jgi:hypothetical protein
MYYAGVGNRDTPEKILQIFTKLASQLEDRGNILRSGGAFGADYAFYNGVKNKNNCQIFIPWEGFGGFNMKHPIPVEAYQIVSEIHPNWNKLVCSVKSLHARNVQQVLGPNLDEPSKYVVCYTRDGCINQLTRTKNTGGTATAILVAEMFNIPVFNLKIESHYDRVMSFLE